MSAFLFKKRNKSGGFYEAARKKTQMMKKYNAERRCISSRRIR